MDVFKAFFTGRRPQCFQWLMQLDDVVPATILQVCLRPRDRFWDIPVPKIDSAFDNLLVPQPCRVPCDYIPKRSYPLFRTRQILNDWLTQNLEEA